jgi:hypothetical protein
MRNTPLRADQVQGKKIPDFLQKEPHAKTVDKAPEVMISREEYKEVIKQAYKEGTEDARKELHKAPLDEIKNELHGGSETTPAQDVDISEHQKLAHKEHRNRNLTADQREGVEEGEKEAAKAQSKEHEQSKQKLENIIDRHDIEIMRAKTVFPFDLFPGTLIIDTTKVTVIKKTMFATESIMTCALKDLSDVSVQTALFLGTIYIKYMPQSPSPGMNEPTEINISCLKRADAMRAKNILRGVLIAAAEKIDLAGLSPEEVVNVIEKFGESEGVN